MNMWTWSNQCIFTFHNINLWLHSLKIEYFVFWVSLTVPAQGDEACASLMRRTPHLRRRTPPRWGSRLLTCKVWFRLLFLYINGIFWFIFCILFCFKYVFDVFAWFTFMFVCVINMMFAIYCMYLYLKWIFDVKLPYCPLCV